MREPRDGEFTVLERLRREGFLTADEDNGCFFGGGEATRMLPQFLRSIAESFEPKVSLFFARPPAPYWAAMSLLGKDRRAITLYDTEGNAFVGEIAVVAASPSAQLAETVRNSRVTVVPEEGVIVRASHPVAAGVVYSAACFSSAVTLLVEAVAPSGKGHLAARDCRGIVDALVTRRGEEMVDALSRGEFTDATSARAAIVQAGSRIVALGLVNASFGNISYALADTLLITATGSFLDSLEGTIVAVPLEGKSTCDGLASSELPSHRQILSAGKYRAILHGHPLFTVVISLLRGGAGSSGRGNDIHGAPVVRGATGGGRYGLDKVLPLALRNSAVAIAQGHGVFCADTHDFYRPLENMLALENACRREYLELTR